MSESVCLSVCLFVCLFCINSFLDNNFTKLNEMNIVSFRILHDNNSDGDDDDDDYNNYGVTRMKSSLTAIKVLQ